MVYGARLESVLGSRPHEFESRILRQRGFLGFQKSLFVTWYHEPTGVGNGKPAKVGVVSSLPRTTTHGIRYKHISA